jgi:hypothetical protein
MMKRSILAAILLVTVVVAAPAETAEVHFAVIALDLEEVTAAEFRVDNLPVDACTIEEHWNTPLILGELGHNMAMGFSPPLPGPIAYLGRVDFTANEELGENWVMRVKASLESGKLVVVDGNYNEHDAYGYWYTFNCAEHEPPFCECYYFEDPPSRETMPIIGMFTDYGGWNECHQDLPFVVTSVSIEPESIDLSEWSVIKALY